MFNSAPEILGSNCPNSTKTDVYAYGMILWELVSRCDPYVSSGIPGRLVQLLVVERHRRPYLGPRQRREIRRLSGNVKDRNSQEATMSPGDIYLKMMKACLEPRSERRPDFSSICNELDTFSDVALDEAESNISEKEMFHDSIRRRERPTRNF